MASKSHLSMDQMIRMTCPTTESLVRQDVNQALKSTCSKLEVKLVPYFYNDGGSKELLCLYGIVTYQYQGNHCSVPIEIWLQEDHPLICPFAYVKPTIDMEISTTSQHVDRSGNIILSYLKNWSYPTSDLIHFLKAMSTAFGQCPPIRSRKQQISHHYSSIDSTFDDNNDILRDSLQTAVLDKIRDRLNDLTQLSKAQIDSLRKTEQDLNDGQFKIQSFIQNIQQQQNQAQNYLTNLQMKIGQLNEATQKMSLSSTSSSSSTSKDQSIRDDAIVTLAPVYKQLLQCYAEEHAIQDLLFYLADGLRRESIGLDIYLKHVRELSRRQYFLRATMQKCRQIAGLTSR